MDSSVASWEQSQAYELAYWINQWPHRHLSVPQLQEHRAGVARWFMEQMGFTQESPHKFAGFVGRVLEIGCGPIGFFELMQSVDVVAQDPLMVEYVKHLPFATLGRRGSATYTAAPLREIPGAFEFVVCSNVLDHTADWRPFLAEIVKCVSERGELLMMSDYRAAPAPGHTQVFTPDEVAAALRELGAVDVSLRRDKIEGRHADGTLYIRAQWRKDVHSTWKAGHENEMAFWRGVISNEEEIKARCDPERSFASWLLPHITTGPLHKACVLDIAAGPVSILGWHVGGTKIDIMPIDVLADQYNAMLYEAGLVPPVRTRQIEAESIARTFAPYSFDLAHVRNALDHCHDPLAVIRGALAVLKPEGKLIVATNINEGVHGDYEGMHQWNLCVENDAIVLWNRLASYNISEIFTCSIIQHLPEKGWLVFSVQK